LTGRAAELAAERSVTGWHLSLTHTESMAMAVAVALG
jgi:phosphopantetheinyl transferase (holo-ACP synthase)